MLKRGQQRKLELSGLVMLVASALGLLLWAALWPIALPRPNFTQAAQPTTFNQTPNATLGESSDARLWNESLQARRLQGWLVDSMATTANSPLGPAPSPLPASGPLSGIQLTGTIIEQGRSYAVVVDRHGSLDLKPVGGTLQLEPAGIRVDAIAAHSVVVSFQGETQMLSISPPLQDGFSDSTSAGPIDAGNTQPLEMTVVETGDMNTQDQSSESTPPPVSPLEDELDWLNGNPANETTGAAGMRGDN